MLQLRCNRASRRGIRCAATLALAWLGLPAAASASEETPPSSDVGLDQLLKLPKTLPAARDEARKGGRTQDEWRERFVDARGDIDEHRAALDNAIAELKELVGEQGSWQMAAPGMPAGAADDSPVSFQLREEIRRERVEVARAERRLRELEIEASLAGVPAEWIGDVEKPAPR